MKTRAKPRTVSDYLKRLAPDQRAALRRLRRAILAAAPGARDCISYGVPALRYRGQLLVWYGAGKTHCSFFPSGIVSRFAGELKGFKTSKGTIRFQPEHPIPAGLVKKLVKARIARLKS
jgi:uncharacterized protein YdhG (YjbR/CyaY superfamily)